ncbi:MAG: hypothetical protein BXU00_01655 [Candidatus Nanoclepta minutus]|uniref:Uncharacterized protein n=1 Tax=Candidatus Nanoclepta minutus TaxID=1940235 RepID=A0A397WN06_9ARCH|nr:MAG: hypothetical protein BXU00_01655 [Candidatus Nanoclepta minutus]
MKRLYAIFKRIEKKEIFDDMKALYNLADELSINFNLENVKKKVISDIENNFFQLLLESKELSVYLTYWRSIDMLSLEVISKNIDPFSIYEHLKNTFIPKYYSVSIQQTQKQDLYE